ncbi:hypothetical protein PAL_GLEAN10017317 [Pteropus alecto]|uniref:Uncharacterized protein n=1 Tax=Pteropus alecto TaxID=9402 RepID=L5K2A2_PTEAL|nr:hypothetical protein PAL_GLEAN10017317 [Pteropus alecto]
MELRLRREETPTGVSLESDAVRRGQQQDDERAVETRSSPSATLSRLSEAAVSEALFSQEKDTWKAWISLIEAPTAASKGSLGLAL